MDIKLLRTIHLYLGCFFAPILLFFIVTGCLQTFNLHHARKNGSYKPPAVVRTAAEVHQHQRVLGPDGWPKKTSQGFQFFVLLMAAGITVTTSLGILMAFKYTKPWIVWACLGAGILIPFLLLRI